MFHAYLTQRVREAALAYCKATAAQHLNSYLRCLSWSEDMAISIDSTCI